MIFEFSGISGVNIWFWVSTIAMSAFFPGESSPASNPSPRAPLRVAMRTTSGACWRLASTRTARCMSEANFITSNMSRLLLHSAASWPRPTFKPAASISGRRAMPFPSFAFELGLWEICVRVSRISASSVSDSQTQWAAMQSGPRMPQS